jgi:excinuclease UvrABC ATPase subunit
MNDLLLQAARQGQHRAGRGARARRRSPIADHVVDLGPGACAAGGEVVFEGTVEGCGPSGTLTGGTWTTGASLKPSVRTPSERWRCAAPATHNLQDVDVDIPARRGWLW